MTSKVFDQKLNVKVLLDLASMAPGHEEGAVRSVRCNLEPQIDNLAVDHSSRGERRKESCARCDWESGTNGVVTALDVHPREMGVVLHVSDDVLVRLR